MQQWSNSWKRLFSMRSVAAGRQLVQQLEARWYGSETSRELIGEAGGWQLEVSPARKLAAEGSTG